MSHEIIRPEYRKQLRQMHESRPYEKPWGTTSVRNAGQQILSFLSGRPARTLLDFGSGQGTLKAFLNQQRPDIEVTEYDPGIPGKDELPKIRFDCIVSTDVLEHVEPGSIPDTLEWLSLHAIQSQFHYIACCPCGLILPDGRNAHLTVREPLWWRTEFEYMPGWQVQHFADIDIRKRGQMRRSCEIALDYVGG